MKNLEKYLSRKSAIEGHVDDEHNFGSDIRHEEANHLGVENGEDELEHELKGSKPDDIPEEYASLLELGNSHDDLELGEGHKHKKYPRGQLC